MHDPPNTIEASIGFIPSRQNGSHLKIAIWHGKRPDSISDSDPNYLGIVYLEKRTAHLDLLRITEILEKNLYKIAGKFGAFVNKAPIGKNLAPGSFEKGFARLNDIYYPSNRKKPSQVSGPSLHRPEGVYTDKDLPSPLPHPKPDPAGSKPKASDESK